ncbi:glutathione S-transferase [Flagelloscypha sp. PMI_526]|nr:glutathione S-transferase [Flagelloscypha sp. PMI_526]
MASRDVSSQSNIGIMKVEGDGSFKRKASTYRDFITKDGKFAPEAGRYHLYVSYACPWATRCLIMRKLKGLDDLIGVTVVSPRMGENGWPFATADEFPAADADPLNNAQHVKDIYLSIEPDYSGRFTVPILWDKKLKTIVNNESSEIIRMFNSEFGDLVGGKPDYYPESLRKDIDELNEWIYPSINNGVYRSGFAGTQEAYEKAVKEVFEGLDKAEKILSSKKYLTGDTLTEADIRLWVTIIRFDPVYVGHFKCNIRTIRGGYPAINKWMKDLYYSKDLPAFRESTNFAHIKTHYYWSHTHINPTRIVPVGPDSDIEPL